MIQKLVAMALRMPIVVLVCTVVVIGAGIFAYSDLDIEAYPNPVPPLVEVITQPNGWSAEEVERYVTVPLEVGLSGMPGLDHVRSQSLFGLSDIKCYFKWGTKYSDARQEVINRLQFVELPKDVHPDLSPWNAIGEVFRYQLVGDGYRLRELKTAQDWILERQFRQVPGVIDVTSFGGETQQYQVSVDPYRLRGHNVQLTQLMDAIGKANENVGGQRLIIGEQSYNVRGIGLLKNVHDIEDVVIESKAGVPVRVKDVAQVEIGAAPRLGKIGHDSEPDIVQGIVLMRYGAETPETLKGIHEKLKQIEQDHLLPPGMKIVTIYDRGNLVKLTTHTVLENLLLGMGLVSVVLFVFLGHTRAALITAINIPIALLVAFIGLVTTGISTNLISIGAVDFGIVVDSTVI
ncbi:MAG TPA: efflux RND transporter permease subunit, partial [Polyangiaceae bacterium]|nr:efflux RND transporter permease subunit [Polyangiaceae bacterium]